MPGAEISNVLPAAHCRPPPPKLIAVMPLAVSGRLATEAKFNSPPFRSSGPTIEFTPPSTSVPVPDSASPFVLSRATSSVAVFSLTQMPGTTFSPLLFRVRALPPLAVTNQLFALLPVVPNARLPIVRGVSSVTVVSAVSAAWLKSAINPEPLAAAALFQLLVLLHKPLAAFVQVPSLKLPKTTWRLVTLMLSAVEVEYHVEPPHRNPTESKFTPTSVAAALFV